MQVLNCLVASQPVGYLIRTFWNLNFLTLVRVHDNKYASLWCRYCVVKCIFFKRIFCKMCVFNGPHLPILLFVSFYELGNDFSHMLYTSEFVEYATGNDVMQSFKHIITCTLYSAKDQNNERVSSYHPFQLVKCFIVKKIADHKGLCMELHYIALCL
jgi:hypothetical protein